MEKTAPHVVYVVAKAPRAGEAKTRLSPPLDPVQAARIADAFLRDTISLAAHAGVDVRLVCRNVADAAYLRTQTGTLPILVQHGAGLSAALQSAFAEGLRAGYVGVGVLAADTPALPSAIIAEAFDSLGRGADVALGRSDDGGYYLLAARRAHPSLFADMSWSTSGVAAETLRRCAALGLRTHLLPTWMDVDDPVALGRLRAALRDQAPQVASHTRVALEALPEELTAAS